MIFLILLAGAFALCACVTPKGNEDKKLPIEKFYTLDDIYVPELMRETGLGLFVYDENGASYKFDTEEAIEALNPSKPIVIFAHGMQYLGGHSADETFEVFSSDVDDEQLSGAINQTRDIDDFMIENYNVLTFRWSQFADDNPQPGMTKVWSVDGVGGTRWAPEPKYYEQLGAAGADRYVEEKDVMNVPVSVYYAACIKNLIDRAGYYGDIRLSGHSLGGELTMATSDYLFTMNEYGLLDKRYLPSQVVLLDPYITANKETPFTVFWTGEKTDGNALALFIGAAKKFKEKGIPCTEIQSGSAVAALPRLESLDKETKKSPLFYELQKNVIYIKYDSSWLSSLNFGGLHTVSRSMYYYSCQYPIPYDTSTGENGNYVGHFNLPVAYALALCGVYYDMEKNNDFNMNNDVYFAAISPDAPEGTKDERKTVVAGCIFEDKNADGFMNDSMASRLKGVKVSLFEQGKSAPIQTAVTGEWGYYKFELPDSATGKNYYVSFEAKGVKPTVKNAFSPDPDNPGKWGFLNDSNIKSDKTSDLFKIEYTKQIIIVNAGFVKE